MSRGLFSFTGTFVARADRAQMIVGVDAGGVSAREGKLYRVVANRRSRLRARFGVEHWPGRRRGKRRRSFRERIFFKTFVVAGRARTILPQISEIEMAGMAVGPGDIHARAGADVNFHAGGLAALVDGNGHKKSCQ